MEENTSKWRCQRSARLVWKMVGLTISPHTGRTGHSVNATSTPTSKKSPRRTKDTRKGDHREDQESPWALLPRGTLCPMWEAGLAQSPQHGLAKQVRRGASALPRLPRQLHHHHGGRTLEGDQGGVMTLQRYCHYCHRTCRVRVTSVDTRVIDGDTVIIANTEHPAIHKIGYIYSRSVWDRFYSKEWTAPE
jgi:hypothetical protein